MTPMGATGATTCRSGLASDRGCSTRSWVACFIGRTGGDQQKRPPRRYYELTAKGKAELGAILEYARSDARFGALVEALA